MATQLEDWLSGVASASPSPVPDEVPEQDAEQLLDRAMAAPERALPHRTRLEPMLRMSLGGLRVHGGPEARTALDRLGARAAQRGADLAFADDEPDVATVAHEVAHAMQAAPGARGVAAADSRAEHEADAFAHTLERGAAPPATPPADGEPGAASGPGLGLGLGLSPSPSAAHLLRIRRLARGTAAIWRPVRSDENASVEDVEVAALSDEPLLAMVSDLLHARNFGLVRAVLDVVSASRWQKLVKSPPPSANLAVVEFLRARFSGARPARNRDASALALEILDIQDDAARELMILELRGDRQQLQRLHGALKNQRQHHPKRASELDALVEYVYQVQRLGADAEEPQCSLAWLRQLYAAEWTVVTPSANESKEPTSRAAGELSLLGLLGVVRQHLEQDVPRYAQQGRNPRSEYAPSRLERSGEEDPDAFRKLLAAIARQLEQLCRTQSLKVIAIALGMVREIADLGGQGQLWGEEILLDVSPALLDALGEPPEPGTGAWDYAKILAAYGDLARRDDHARQVVEALAPRVNEGVASSDFELRPPKKAFHPDRTLTGALVALSNLPHETAEAHRTFEEIQPLLEELLATDEQATTKVGSSGLEIRQRTPEVVPESITLALTAYAQLLGRTELENLPPNVQSFLKRLVTRALVFVPRHLTSQFSTVKLNQSQVVRICAALLQFRNPPREAVTLLGQLTEPASKALEGYVKLDDLEAILEGYTSTVGDISDLRVLYEAAIAKLGSLVESSPQPSPTVVRLVVLAYNRRDTLIAQADWYTREATRREGFAQDPQGAAQARDHAAALKERGKHFQVALEELAIATVTKVQQAIGEYPENQQRRVLFELTRIQGLAISKAPSSVPGADDEAPILGELDQAVAGTYGQLSESRSMIGPLEEASTHHLACLLFDYSWMRVHSQSDAQLCTDLIAELQRRGPSMSPADVTGMLGVLAQVRRPPTALVQFLEGMTLVVARLIRDRLGELDFDFLARSMSAYREHMTPVVVRFLELAEHVIQHELDADHVSSFASLLHLTVTYVRADDTDLDEARTRGERDVTQLRFQIVAELRRRVGLEMSKGTGSQDGGELYDAERSRVARMSLPWRDYDRHFTEMYPPGEHDREDVESTREASESRFASSGTAQGLGPDRNASYPVHTISPDGSLLSTEVMDHVIFRELTMRQFDYVLVELPSSSHIDKLKGVVVFRGKEYRYDVYGGSSLKAKKKPGQVTSTGTIKTIGVEARGIEFFRKLFNYQEGFFYAQRALLPNDAKPTIGLRGRLNGLVWPDDQPFRLFEGLPFRPYDGWGFIKRSLAETMLAARAKKDQPDKRTPNPETSNLSYQAYHWYRENQDTIDEAVIQGVEFFREHREELTKAIAERTGAATGNEEPAEPDPAQKEERDTGATLAFRAMTSGRPLVRNNVAVPVQYEAPENKEPEDKEPGRPLAKHHKLVLPAEKTTRRYEPSSKGMLVGRSPFDNPNFFPLQADQIAYRGPDDADREDPSLAASDFLSEMESIQYTMTGYLATMQPDKEQASDKEPAIDSGSNGPDEAGTRLAFFKGMLGIVPDARWPGALEGVDVVVSNQDIKLDESWEGKPDKVRYDRTTRFTFDGMLVVKDWYDAQSHVGVPTKVQKWLAGDYDGDLAVLMFAAKNPALFRQVIEEFRPTGVSSKIKKTTTPSGENLSRARQIADIRSPVLGTWSSICDQVNATQPDEERPELALELSGGSTVGKPDQLAELIAADPTKHAALLAQLRSHDELLITTPERWLEEASPEEALAYQTQVLARVRSSELTLPDAARELVEDRARARRLDDKNAVKRWLAPCGEGTQRIVRNVFASELLEDEIQMGFKVGTDGYKTAAETRKYQVRAGEVRSTSADLHIGDRPVPYGKSLIGKIKAIGLPTAESTEWREVYYRCRELYGIPARILEGMILALAEVDAAAWDAGFQAWQEDRARVRKEKLAQQQPPPPVDQRIAELEDIFQEIFISLGITPGEQGEASREPAPTSRRPPRSQDERTSIELLGGNQLDNAEQDAPDAAPVSGLPNIGNTCYLNGAMQIIAAHATYRGAFDSQAPLPREAAEVRRLGKALLDKIANGAPITARETSQFLAALGDAGALEAHANAQQDASELLQQILTTVRAPETHQMQREWTIGGEGGQNDEAEHMLRLHGVGAAAQRTRTMSDLLAANELDSHYGENGALTELFTQQFGALPDPLTINLNRTGYSSLLGQRFKRAEKLGGTMALTMPASMAPDAQQHTYRLTAFTVHLSGGGSRSASAGHYVSYVLRDGRWYLIDDAHVSEVSVQAAEAASQGAYMFVYEHQAVGNAVPQLANQGVDVSALDHQAPAKLDGSEPHGSTEKSTEKSETSAVEEAIAQLQRKQSLNGLKQCGKAIRAALASAPDEQIIAVFIEALRVVERLGADHLAAARYLTGLAAEREALLEAALQQIVSQPAQGADLAARIAGSLGKPSEPSLDLPSTVTAPSATPIGPTTQQRERLTELARTARQASDVKDLVDRIATAGLSADEPTQLLSTAIKQVVRTGFSNPMRVVRPLAAALEHAHKRLGADVVKSALDWSADVITTFSRAQTIGNIAQALRELYGLLGLDDAVFVSALSAYGVHF